MKSHCVKTPTALPAQPLRSDTTKENMKDIKQYKALTFDCYGTLIDWESGIWDAMQPLLMHGQKSITRAQGLEAFASIETEQERKTPDKLYPDLLTRVHKKLAGHFEIKSTDTLDADFGQSVPHWPAFPDTADALRILKQHFKLVILSNVNRQGFAASNKKLGVEFDAIYTAEDVGSYKPDPRNFDYLIEHVKADLDVAANELLHTAQSLHHDHVPAKKATLDRCWIDRQNLATSDNWGATAVVTERPDVHFQFPTLMALAKTL